MLKPPSGFTSPPDEQAWEKHGHRVTLLVEHGRLKNIQGRDEAARRTVRCPCTHDPSLPSDAGRVGREGVTLRPSRPPVAPLALAAGAIA
jgi:hypothetical protein